jgi:hypothetical protein
MDRPNLCRGFEIVATGADDDYASLDEVKRHLNQALRDCDRLINEARRILDTGQDNDPPPGTSQNQ